MRRAKSAHKKLSGGGIMKRWVAFTIMAVFALATAGFAYPVSTKVSNSGSRDSRPSPGYMATLMPKKELDEREASGLTKMREEEKLARDVYQTLYEKWGLIIFKNISESEQRHMDAVKSLLNKYEMKDPVEKDERGAFTSSEMQSLYEQLVSQGMQSMEDALKVGATIEDLDIADLDELIASTDNEDLKAVYENLRRGSENHLRAFTAWLERLGIEYKPKYISDEEYRRIISSRTVRTCKCPFVDATVNDTKEMRIRKRTEEHLRFTISIRNAENATTPMEYFIWVTLPDGEEYSLQADGSWVPGIKPTYVGIVPNLEDITVVDLPPEIIENLPEGRYVFHFAVDANPNGMLDIFGMESTSSFEIEE